MLNTIETDRNDDIYMRRCIELAKNGLGTTSGNPMVGAVIVYNGKIIGEGWHRKAGEPHAEVNAINSVKNKNLLRKSTIYVSLEPCSHFGKTPPCSDLIIKHNIKNIVIGTIDTFSKVCGNGISKLKNNGCNVIVGVLEKECISLNKRFFSFHNKKRPYIILKWAETKDGFIDKIRKPDSEKKPTWISNKYSKQLVHKWRSEEDAILVGTNTVIEDNPTLNTRLWSGKNPTRIIIDRNLRISDKYSVLDNSIKTIVITSKYKDNLKNIFYEFVDFSSPIFIQKILNVLIKHRIQSVIVEGGRYTLQSFIDSNLWDEARVFRSEKRFFQGIEAPSIKHKKHSVKNIENNLLTTYFYH